LEYSLLQSSGLHKFLDLPTNLAEDPFQTSSTILGSDLLKIMMKNLLRLLLDTGEGVGESDEVDRRKGLPS